MGGLAKLTDPWKACYLSFFFFLFLNDVRTNARLRTVGTILLPSRSIGEHRLEESVSGTLYGRQMWMSEGHGLGDRGSPPAPNSGSLSYRGDDDRHELVNFSECVWMQEDRIDRAEWVKDDGASGAKRACMTKRTQRAKSALNLKRILPICRIREGG
ncbi:hypothetical protein MPH_05667 [Macrophomina phaseolina MS6]|uniref:Uncharacterized protein n=1 Tax=Macrophomina phaseolina (strain MS6) TaxID=1126212 RepID=K2SJX3_MACPH|nr:hypothetical protein MPH_05667 [Macrophomina phaseolina MS6]